MMRALYYRILDYQPENRAYLDSCFDVVELEDPRDDSDKVLNDVGVLFAPLGFLVGQAKLNRCPMLRAIISNTTGIPHIDHDAAEKHGIAVCALNDEPAFLETISPTAEHAIGLMLAAWRRVPGAHDAAGRGEWNRRPWGAPKMFSRMRLGLVGYGRLGRKVARIASAMEMDVAFYDPKVDGSEVSVLDLARRSDVLSLHATLTSASQNLVSREVLEALPRGAMVVNTARGEILDSDALIDLLESGHLRCAALDTVAGEYQPDFSDHFRESRLAIYARAHDNLILTPHIGGSTVDAWSETERFVIDKACRVLGLETGQ